MENIAETLRPVGMLEKWSTARHSLGFYTNVGLTARYVSSTGRPLTREVLYAALESLISTHAPLSITVLSEDTSAPCFARLRCIDLDEVVSFIELSVEAEKQQEEIDRIISEQHNNKFKKLGQLPGWRVVVIRPMKQEAARGVDVAFIYHHGIGDGGSGKAFHMALLKALNNPQGAEVKSIIYPPNMPLLPPLESLIRLPISILHLLKICIRMWLYKLFQPSYLYGAPIQIPLKNTFRTLIFSASTTTALLTACRREQTTITALLQALLEKSFFEVLPAHGMSHITELITSISINLRRFIPDVGDETIGVFVYSNVTTHSSREAGAVWEVARRCRASIEAALAAGTRNTNTGLLKYLNNYEKYLLSQLGQRREQSIEVSNLGMFKGEGEGEWAVKRVLFSQSASVTGCAVVFNVVSVKEGEMCVGVSLQEGVVENEVVEEVVERFRRELEDISA